MLTRLRAMQETHSVLLRMRELAVQGANGTFSDTDLDAPDAEFQQLEAEIDRIAANTTWAGKSFNQFSCYFQVERHLVMIEYPLRCQMRMRLLWVYKHTTLQTMSKAQEQLQVDTAISKISEERGRLGAISNRLGSTISNLDQ